MNWNSSFFWKLVYGGLIVVLLVPLYVLGQPATSVSQGQLTGGGKLAQMRSEHGLAQASLGEIDPASESMKLATLGLRGVAANILWYKATEYKKKEDWDNLSAALNQITKLQSNFLGVWEFQGHNLAYNVSAEFDDYRHRYHWVKKGIDFMILGTHYNSREPRLPHSVGWYFGQKLGRSDEYRQFRRLFREDTDYHREVNDHGFVDMFSPDVRGRHSNDEPDNWLVSRQWYIFAEDLVDNHDRSLRGKSPLIFYSDRPKSLMNYAAAIEEEGHFGEVAKAAWNEGLVDWQRFGSRLVPSSWGVSFRLDDLDEAEQEVEALRAELESLTEGVHEKVVADRLAALSDEERAVYVPTHEERVKRNFSQKEFTLSLEVAQKLRVSDMDLAENAPTEKRDRAIRVALKLAQAEQHKYRIERYREQVNYDYWHTRCEAEQTDTAADARENLYLAKQFLDDARLEEAKKHYDIAWDLWYELFQKFPDLQDDLSADDLKRPAQSYMAMLGQLGEELPADFKLRWLIEQATIPGAPAGEPAPGTPEAAAAEAALEAALREASEP